MRCEPHGGGGSLLFTFSEACIVPGNVGYKKTINLYLGGSPNSHEFRKRLEDITIGDTPKSKNRCNYERP